MRKKNAAHTRTERPIITHWSRDQLQKMQVNSTIEFLVRNLSEPEKFSKENRAAFSELLQGHQFLQGYIYDRLENSPVGQKGKNWPILAEKIGKILEAKDPIKLAISGNYAEFVEQQKYLAKKIFDQTSQWVANSDFYENSVERIAKLYKFVAQFSENSLVSNIEKIEEKGNMIKAIFFESATVANHFLRTDNRIRPNASYDIMMESSGLLDAMIVNQVLHNPAVEREMSEMFVRGRTIADHYFAKTFSEHFGENFAKWDTDFYFFGRGKEIAANVIYENPNINLQENPISFSSVMETFSEIENTDLVKEFFEQIENKSAKKEFFDGLYAMAKPFSMEHWELLKKLPTMVSETLVEARNFEDSFGDPTIHEDSRISEKRGEFAKRALASLQIQVAIIQQFELVDGKIAPFFQDDTRRSIGFALGDAVAEQCKQVKTDIPQLQGATDRASLAMAMHWLREGLQGALSPAKRESIYQWQDRPERKKEMRNRVMELICQQPSVKNTDVPLTKILRAEKIDSLRNLGKQVNVAMALQENLAKLNTRHFAMDKENLTFFSDQDRDFTYSIRFSDRLDIEIRNQEPAMANVPGFE